MPNASDTAAVVAGATATPIATATAAVDAAPLLSSFSHGYFLLLDVRRRCRRFRPQIRSQWERTLTGNQKAFLKEVHEEAEASRKAPAQTDRAKQRSERKELLRQKQEARAARMRGGGGSGGSGGGGS